MKTSLLVRSRLLGGRFSPQTLFALSEPGVWYDPSDLTTMFTDTAGTTPATIGSAVALLLDKSLGATEKLGPELVTNGAFTAGTDWTLGAGWTIGSGVATKTAVTAAELSQAVSLTTGRAYELTYTMTRTAGTLTPRITGGTTVNFTARTAGGTYTEIVSAVTGNTTLEFSADALFVGTVDNVTLKILTGFHATQATLAARPILGRVPSVGRRNLLTRTEDSFGSLPWVVSGATVTSQTNAGWTGNTIQRLVANNGVGGGTTAQGGISPSPAITVVSGETYVFSVYAKASGFNTLRLREGVSTGANLIFDLTTGGISGSSSGWAGFIENAGNGWWRCAARRTVTATTYSVFMATVEVGNGTDGILIGGVQLETGSTATAYQRVGSTFDVTEAGQPDNYYLSFDGVDDSMVTPTITPGVDKVQVFAGVRKLSDAARGTIVEHSATIDSNNGAFHLTAPNAASATFGFESKGTTLTDAVASATAPITSVLTGLGDIAGDTATIRVTGAQQDQDTGDQGTGNYLAYPLYIGRRGGTTLPLNGQIFSLIVRFGANLTNDQIVTTEKWVSGKTAGVTL